MSEPASYNGILLGLLEGPNHEAGIGIGIAGGKTLVLSPEAAGSLLNNLGDMLDSIGFFDVECTCGNCTPVKKLDPKLH